VAGERNCRQVKYAKISKKSFAITLPLVPAQGEIGKSIFTVFGTGEGDDAVLDSIVVGGGIEDCFEARRSIVPDQLCNIPIRRLESGEVVAVLWSVGILGGLQSEQAELFLDHVAPPCARG
jgi:hypothetical protein